MTASTIDESARKDLAANPQLSGGPAAAQLQRFLALEDILVGFSEGIDGGRLEAGLTWAKHGDAQANRDVLVRLFASRWIAAQEQGEWTGDATAEGARDLDELTAVAAALATRDEPRPKWIGIDAAAGAPQEFEDWAAKFNASRAVDDRVRVVLKALRHYSCSCEEGRCAMSADDDDTPVDEQMCGRVANKALSTFSEDQ